MTIDGIARRAVLAAPAVADGGGAITLGVALLVVGLLLCVLGARSILLATACAGFGLGAALAEALGAGLVVVVVVAVAGAVGALLLVRLASRVGLFVVGALAGGVVGVILAGSLPLGPVLLLVVVLAAATIGGALLDRFRGPVLVVVTAVAGAGLVLAGIARFAPGPLGFLRDPDTVGETALRILLWAGVALAGWAVQRRARVPRRS